MRAVEVLGAADLCLGELHTAEARVIREITSDNQ